MQQQQQQEEATDSRWSVQKDGAPVHLWRHREERGERRAAASRHRHLGLEEVDGDAVVLQAVDPQLAAARPRQLVFGDELQQPDQRHAGLQLRVHVTQLQLLLQRHTSHTPSVPYEQ